MNDTHSLIIRTTRQWVENIVIGLNLCPFAKRELVSNRLHLCVSDAATEEQLLIDLHQALLNIASDDAIETTLLIHPGVLNDFHDYNQFLDAADALLQNMNLEGIYQIASFHPAYQFADTDQNDITNYTNRSPYPMLHLLSEQSLANAIASHPNPGDIPVQNQAMLTRLGLEKLKALLGTN